MCSAAINCNPFQSGPCLRGLFWRGDGPAIIYCGFCFKVKYFPPWTVFPKQACLFVSTGREIVPLDWCVCVAGRGRKTASNLAAAVGWKRRSEQSNLAACQCPCVCVKERENIFFFTELLCICKKIIMFCLLLKKPIFKSRPSKRLACRAQTY